MELSTLVTMVGLDTSIPDNWRLDGDDAVKLELALDSVCRRAGFNQE